MNASLSVAAHGLRLGVRDQSGSGTHVYFVLDPALNWPSRLMSQWKGRMASSLLFHSLSLEVSMKTDCLVFLPKQSRKCFHDASNLGMGFS